VFLEVETRQSAGHNIVANYEYRALPKEIRDAISLAEFIGVSKGRSRPEPGSQAPQKDPQHALVKVTLSTFDGSNKGTTGAWMKMLGLNPRPQEYAKELNSKGFLLKEEIEPAEVAVTSTPQEVKEEIMGHELEKEKSDL
ncbi:hypothetical protein KI387_020334, partial [Taxus chinensis]